MIKRQKLYAPGEVAEIFGVDPKTVTRWAKDGKIRCIRLPGKNGHRRYPADEVERLLQSDTVAEVESMIPQDPIPGADPS